MNDFSFKISMPHDEGYVGRKCKNQECAKYFKIYYESVSDVMYCPYCGIQYNKNEMMTDEQSDYINRVIREKALELVYKSIGQMKSSKYFKPNKVNYKAKSVNPNYEEKELDSQLECPSCNCQFQVYGIFGFCPGCKSENISIYDANFTIIKNEIIKNNEDQRSLRHAYADIVSAFEIMCKNKAKLITDETTNFQMIFESRKFFKKHNGLDILNNLNESEILTIRRIFQKRHAYQHYDGTITDKYIKLIPEDKKLIDSKAQLSLSEFESGAQVLRKIVDNLIKIP